MHKKLAVIIVSYNSINDTLNSINSLRELQFDADYEIIVIENGKSNEWDSLSREFNNLKVIYPESNLGFSKANNLGVSNTSAEYIMLLNPDTILTEDYITPILNFIENKKDIGACGPALYYKNMRYQNSAGFGSGLFFEFCEAFYLIKLLRMFEYKFKIKNKSEPIRVNWLSAACILIKREVFLFIKGFDELFFLNYEDIDLCNRLEKAGFGNYYFPKLKCIHIGLKSQGENFENLIVNRYKSKIIYFKKYYNFFLRLFIRIMHVIGLILRIITLFFSRKNKINNQSYNGYKQSLAVFFSEPI